MKPTFEGKSFIDRLSPRWRIFVIGLAAIVLVGVSFFSLSGAVSSFVCLFRQLIFHPAYPSWPSLISAMFWLGLFNAFFFAALFLPLAEMLENSKKQLPEQSLVEKKQQLRFLILAGVWIVVLLVFHFVAQFGISVLGFQILRGHASVTLTEKTDGWVFYAQVTRRWLEAIPSIVASVYLFHAFTGGIGLKKWLTMYRSIFSVYRFMIRKNWVTPDTPPPSSPA